MKRFLRSLLKYLAYLGAAVVILLAVAVGLFRLLLPKLPAYQDEIKEWANSAIGLQVEFSGMDARWRLSGPELTFYDARLLTKDSGAAVLNADEVSVGVGLLRLLLDFELVADRVVIRDAHIDVVQQAGGGWLVQGMDVDDLVTSRMSSSRAGGPLVVIGRELGVDLQLANHNEPIPLEVESLQFHRDERQLGIDAAMTLPKALGTRLDISASQRLTRSATVNPWQFFVEAKSLNLAGLSRLWPAGLPVLGSGMADIDLWLDLAAHHVQMATANFRVTNVVIDHTSGGASAGASANPIANPSANTSGKAAANAPFAVQGRAEFSSDQSGWLLAANEFRMTTPLGEWPESSLQLRATTGPSGAIDRLHGSASYVNLDDLHYLTAWVPEKYRRTAEKLALSGVLRDVDVTVSEPGTPAARFDVSAGMERAGIAAYEGWPGIRGFSGKVRADQSGGRLEIDASGMRLDLNGWFAGPIDVDLAAGTVLWRRSTPGTTILSDSIHLQNEDIDSQSSFQITLPAGGDSPVVDFQSRWSLRNIAAIDRYLPVRLLKPALYRWLDDALVAGSIPTGTTRFVGPLDKFPFDHGEGTFRIEAHADDAILRYSGRWPDVKDLDVDLVIDNTRLYSFQNSGTSLGNRTVNARVEIPDLRDPVLSVKASSTGTLASIRDFSMQSPISTLFGGQLASVDVGGDASFNLSLTYPILDQMNYRFRTTIESDNGSLKIDGLPAPITGLHGGVTITRDEMNSEALAGQFLGKPITIELQRAGDDLPSYSVIARARGNVDVTGLVQGLGVPFGNLLNGETAYQATVRFPKAALDKPVPLTIAIESDLQGMALDVPAPIGKEKQAAKPLAFTIAFPEEGRIESVGSLTSDVRWNIDFARTERGWDFDRGVLELGGTEPGIPKTRGLHIEGRTPVVNFDAWLDLAGAGGSASGFGDRIRSVDLTVDDLYVIGQHLGRHRAIVNRSAFGWAVQLNGEDAIGSITVPYDFAGGRPIVLEMKKLTLPGGDGNAGDAAGLVDPRTLPRISVVADEFSLGQRHLGSLKTEFLPTSAGLEANAFATKSDSFSTHGSAGWIVDESDKTGQRTYVTGRLTSHNVKRTMQQLNYQPGIESKDMNIKFDVSWSGGPREDFLGSLDGSVSVRLGSGQLNEIEPGAGRVFGLLSIAALPRRLSLDFRDVFERGFGFDEITGNFRLDDGQAYTCDLSLDGPAADVGVVGRAGLVARDYHQAAVVSSNVGNTLPIVGAVVGGPQVVAALLLFSQIFKKPLQEMGQIYYGIEGGWDDPVIDVVDAPRFAATSQMADCLKKTK